MGGGGKRTAHSHTHRQAGGKRTVHTHNRQGGKQTARTHTQARGQADRSRTQAGRKARQADCAHTQGGGKRTAHKQLITNYPPGGGLGLSAKQYIRMQHEHHIVSMNIRQSLQLSAFMH